MPTDPDAAAGAPRLDPGPCATRATPVRSIARVVLSEPRRLVVAVPRWPGFRPGQFAMLELDPSHLHLDPLLPRPMAIYRARGWEVEFRFRPVGRGTRALGALAPGAELGVLGPLGRGFPEPDAERGSAILIGGGTGIATLYPLACRMPGARVLLGGRTRSDLLGREDFEQLEVDLELATDDGSAGLQGPVTDLLKARPGDAVYACGPTPMLRRAADRAQAAGARVWVALEAHMACGFGVCLGCAVPRAADGGFAYVCRDGPVFDARDLDWEGLP
ncbi:MAG: dihydroorotate dehydrogenase electron transfer subunit [Myxococcota bacterium]